MAAQSQMKKEMNEKASEQVLKKIQKGKFEKENEEMMKKNAENLQKNQPQALIAKPMNEETMLKPEELKKELKHGQKDLMAAQSQMKKEMNEKASEQVLKKIQ